MEEGVPIEALITEGRRRREEIEQANQRVLVAAARRVAEDERLDTLLLGLGRAALDASGGQRDRDPYRRLFARSPSEMAGLALGAELAEVRRIEAKLVAVGARWPSGARLSASSGRRPRRRWRRTPRRRSCTAAPGPRRASSRASATAPARRSRARCCSA
jgi:hypothetical protein